VDWAIPRESYEAYKLLFCGMTAVDHILIDDQTVHKIKDKLISRSETLAVAESVTTGILQTTLASATDASLYFQGGITVYNLGQKARHLHVNPIHAESCNCVSDQVAKEMALNVNGLFSSDWGIGVTGYATMDPAVKMKKPFAHFAIAYKDKILAFNCLEHDLGNPQLIQYFYVNEILKALLQILHNTNQ